MNNRKIILFILFTFFCFGFLQSISSSAKKEAVRTEMKLIKALEKQIDFYKDIAYKKVDMKKLAEQGKFDKLKKNFHKDEKRIIKFLNDGEIDKSYQELKFAKVIYRKIPEIENDLLLLQGYVEYLNNNDESASEFFEKIVAKGNSTELAKARYYLADCYLRMDKNSKAIELLANQQNLTNDEKFTLANSYFNTADYQKSSEIAQLLLSNKTFAIEATQLLALSYFAQDNFAKAIETLSSITTKDFRKDKNYPLSFLFLGRMNYQLDEFDASLTNYLKFNELMQGNVDESVLYEIGNIYYEMGNFIDAKFYLDELSKRNTETIYVNESKVLLAKIRKAAGESDSAITTLDNSIEEINQVNKTLDAKIKSVDKKDYELKENVFKSTNEILAAKNIGPATQSFSLIKKIEESQIEYQKRISVFENFVETLKNDNNPNIIEELGIDSLLTDYVNPLDQIELSLLSIEKTSVQIIAYQFIETRKYLTFEDYDYARFLANQIYNFYLLDEKWAEIQELAMKKNKLKAIPAINKFRKDLKVDIASTKMLGYYIFGKPDKAVERQQQLAEEYTYLQNKKKELFETRTNVYKNFNKIIANKLTTKQEKVEELLNNNEQSYLALIKSVKNYSQRLVEKYEFEKIDLLYQEALDLTIQE